MKIIFVLMCVAIVVWIIALNVDARLFDGKFLIKRVQRSEEFLRILEGILECETKPIEEWPVEYSDWLGDKMYIPLQNSYLEKYRDSPLSHCSIDKRAGSKANRVELQALQNALKIPRLHGKQESLAFFHRAIVVLQVIEVYIFMLGILSCQMEREF